MTVDQADIVTQNALARAADEVQAALTAGRERLLLAEQRTEQLRGDLKRMQTSVTRRLFERVLMVALLPFRLIVRPIDSTRWLFARLTGGRRIAAWLGGYERFSRRQSPLRHQPFHVVESGAEPPRWIGPLAAGGRPRVSLFAHPPTALQWRIQPAPGAAVTVDCALHPSTWQLAPGPVEFEVQALYDDGRTVSRSLVSNPWTHWGDRAWRRLSLPVAGACTLTLRTRVVEGQAEHWTWAVWGEPRIEWQRPRSELYRSLSAAVRALGLLGALRRAASYEPVDTEAARFQEWCRRHALDAQSVDALRARIGPLPYRPLFSIITPVWNTDPRWLRACWESVRQQVYDRWEWCIADDASTKAETRSLLAEIASDPRVRLTTLAENGHICKASNAALALAGGEFVVMLDHDDELTPDALAEFVLAINEDPSVDFLYSDEDKLDLAGQRCDPFFKPDWAPEFFRTCMYTCHAMVLRRSLVEEVGGFRPGLEGAQDYDLALRIIGRTPRIRHVSRILYHWRKLPESTASSGQAKPWALPAAHRALADHVVREGLEADVLDGAVQGLFRVRFRIRGTPRVTIVIPTDGRVREVNGRRLDLLANAVTSIAGHTDYEHYDLLVVDNGRLRPDTLQVLAGVAHRRVSYRIESAFNFAHKLNFAARHATGDHLVVFNDDLEVITDEWLTALLEFSQQRDVGAVGAKLLYPDGRLQHAGIVLGVCGVAAHAWHGLAGDTPGYASSVISIRNFSAVTGACLMTRRSVFEEVGGFNEQLPIDFNDVDYCLRVGAKGYRTVYTPYARLYHHESGTLGPRTQRLEEMTYMERQWGALLRRDPYYNEHLTRDFPDFRLGV